MSRLSKRALVTMAVIVSLGAGGLLLRSRVHASSPDGRSKPDQTAKACRKDLRLAITESGGLKAIKYNKLTVECRRQVKLVSILPEGSVVKKGDTLIELSREETETALRQLEVEARMTHQSIEVAEGGLRVQGITNENRIQSARAAVVQAVSELSKYQELEGPKLSKELAVKLEQARVSLEASQKTLAD